MNGQDSVLVQWEIRKVCKSFVIPRGRDWLADERNTTSEIDSSNLKSMLHLSNSTLVLDLLKIKIKFIRRQRKKKKEMLTIKKMIDYNLHSKNNFKLSYLNIIIYYKKHIKDKLS